MVRARRADGFRDMSDNRPDDFPGTGIDAQFLLETFLEQGGPAAAEELRGYLILSEQTVLGAFTRLRRG